MLENVDDPLVGFAILDGNPQWRHPVRIVAVERVGQFDELFQGFAVRGNDVNTSQVLHPFLVQFSVKSRASKKQKGRHSHPGQYIDRVVVSKINCSKNDA